MTEPVPPLILASSSERRIEILTRLGIDFEVKVPDVDERIGDEDIPKACMRISRLKVDAVRSSSPRYENRWILGADTLVVIGGHTLGKPVDEADAVSMLERLSGGTHSVITGISLFSPRDARSYEAFERTEVTFAALSAEDIAWYVSTGEWEGAAGAYKIQDRGGCLIEAIMGSYTNVVGLPTRLFYGMVVEHGFPGMGHRDLPIRR